MNKLGLTFADTKFIRDNEGCKLTAYPDLVSHGDPFTIGWGSTGPWVHAGLTITQQEADDHFLNTICYLENSLVKLLKINVTKNQYVALIDFAYNLGIGALSSSTLLKKLNNSDIEGASKEFPKWCHDKKGNVIQGLLNRRNAETALFVS